MFNNTRVIRRARRVRLRNKLAAGRWRSTAIIGRVNTRYGIVERLTARRLGFEPDSRPRKSLSGSARNKILTNDFAEGFRCKFNYLELNSVRSPVGSLAHTEKPSLIHSKVRLSNEFRKQSTQTPFRTYGYY